MQRTTIDFGIDLGTTNSSIAVIDEIDAKVIPNKGGSGLTPSAVWIDKRGHIQVGQEAKLRALGTDQDNAIVEFKLRMGLGAEGRKVFARSGREMLPEELSSEVLKSLKLDVQTNLGEDFRTAVITVPAAFENSQTNATNKAAELAGLRASPLLLEPVAAALAYGFQSESENVYWFVYDFGGGTFDAAVMRIRDGLIQVINHDGDNHLGGKLIDWDIVTKKLIPDITSRFDLPGFERGNLNWKSAVGRMKYEAEVAKIEVCRQKAPYEIWIENLCEDANGNSVDYAFTLKPEDVEEVSRPYIEKSLILCKKTLERDGLRGSDLERILMVGGSTLNPWVRDAVQAELGNNVEFGIDPVTVVARGAAIFAATQVNPIRETETIPAGTWRIQIEHEPVGNVEDPDIGGHVTSPTGQSLEGFTIELIDTKSQWRTGRIQIGAEGVFMTQLYAEKHRRHEFAIELCDPTGTKIATSPDRVSYRLGVKPDNPPAAWTIGVGLANGGVATYIKKGTKLPSRLSLDHWTIVPLRTGHPEDELKIPVLEGEHTRAERNHEIGKMIITGDKIRRDLPVGSPIEITVLMDTSQQIRLLAYANSLDQEFEVTFDPGMKLNSLETLREEMDKQKLRLEKARETAARSSAPRAEEAITRIERQQLLQQIEELCRSAQDDLEAISQLDRQLRELAAIVDEIEDSLEWPVLLAKAEEERTDAEGLADQYGEAGDHTKIANLKEEMERAKEAQDPDLLRRSTQDFISLWFTVAERQPGYHINRFNRLVERIGSMQDPSRAEQIINQGRRAIDAGDVDALKAANRQLASLLPPGEELPKGDPNGGGTQTRL